MLLQQELRIVRPHWSVDETCAESDRGKLPNLFTLELRN